MKKIGTIPQMGYGTWKRAGDEGYREVVEALEAGYRHIDTAEHYDNEEHVGRALAGSGLARGDIFITTKVGPENLGPGQVMRHAKASLEKLRLDHVDLYLIHWPSLGDRYDINDYMAQILAVRDAGLSKLIGVSNFTKRHVDAAVKVAGKGVIATNQVEIHPMFQNRVIVDHCRTHGIAMTAYAPLARGAVKDNATLLAIGKKHGATPGQVALAFLMAEGHIVIPTSTSQERMRENLRSVDLVLSDEDINAIRGMDAGMRLVSGSWAPKWD
jgi:2,5-diketo-D-gluconate reductase B